MPYEWSAAPVSIGDAAPITHLTRTHAGSTIIGFDREVATATKPRGRHRQIHGAMAKLQACVLDEFPADTDRVADMIAEVFAQIIKDTAPATAQQGE